MSTPKDEVPGVEPRLAGFPRQQMALWVDGSCALLRGFEAIRKFQMQAAHHALAHHAGVAQKLKAACSVAELLALQADLIRFDSRAALHYWQQLGATALETQRQLMLAAAQGAAKEAGEAMSTAHSYGAFMPRPAAFFGGNGAPPARG